MKFSIVINTFNRAASLQRTLKSLQWQMHDSFEVIVVNGPSTDDTRKVLDVFGEDVRSIDCPTRNLSQSRNIGIAAASGEIVAFIDDDAIPEPGWIAELEEAFDDERVGGAGGIVFDHTGCTLQYEYSVSDRLGRTKFDVRPPFAPYMVPGADRFLYLQGTNMSFRRSCLAGIGGFDEEIEYNYDEVEVCLQLIDLGYKLKPLSNAAVHHEYLASHLRNAHRLFTDPYFAIKNRAYFALRHGQSTHTTAEVLTVLTEYIDEVKAAARCQYDEGRLNASERDFFIKQVDRGIEIGIEHGMEGQRKGVEVPEADEDSFTPFPTKYDKTSLRVCFVSQEFPPGDFGGIGRFTADLAAGFAEQGHEVHVVTRSADNASVDFEDGVWMHRVTTENQNLHAVAEPSLRGNLEHIGAVYSEVSCLQERRSLDLVSAPLWAAEGLICMLDPRFPTVTTLMTTMRTVADLHKSWEGMPAIQSALRVEKAAVEASSYLHAISHAILDEVEANYDIRKADTRVIPLGVRDIVDKPGKRADSDDSGTVEVLFVGRLEFRKGVDVLLEAIVTLAAEFPNAHFTLAGKDTVNTEIGESYRSAFNRRARDMSDLLRRVTFAGLVPEDELRQLYASADIFCAPSRYESFGLVLVEAMRYGIPVIGCCAGGMTEIVDSERTGLLAEPGDVDSLVDCLRALLSDRARRVALGARGRRRYEECFTLQHAVTNTVRAYADIAKKHREQRKVDDAKDVIARRLSDVLCEPVGMSSVVAQIIANDLLGNDRAGLDPLSKLDKAWELPTDEFIEAAYFGVLDRPPDAQGLPLARAALGNGLPRVMFVRGLARSDIARDLGIDTSWLPQLMRLAGDSYVERLAATWLLPDEEFVACAYEILLERRPDTYGLTTWLDHMRAGTSRVDLVRELVRSDEAQEHGVEGDWLEIFQAAAPLWEEQRRTPLPRRLRLRRAIGRSAILGPASRSLARSVRSARQLRDVPEIFTELGGTIRRQDSALADLAGRLDEQATIARARASADDARIDRVESELMGLSAKISEGAKQSQEQLTIVHREAEASREEIAKERSVVNDGIQRLNDRIRRQGFLMEQVSERIDVLQSKSEALALDLREQVVAPREEGHVQPHVRDESNYRQMLKAMNGELKINVGSGEKPLAGYVNVDFRELPTVDVIADARGLPFEKETLTEIMSAHLVEHFRQHQLASVVLPHWRGLLKAGGHLRIVCPNWEAMLTRVQSGEMNLKNFQTLTFGLQDYSGDDHFAMYTPDSLRELVEDAGFDEVEILVRERQNGLCPEMELLARRP